MAVYHYVKAVRLGHLHDELLAATIVPTLVQGAPDNSQCWITVPDTTPQASVDAVVAAHNAAAWDTADAQPAQDAAAARALVVQVAQSAAGVRFDQLSAAQVRALAAVLFWKAGALDATGVVRPLAAWVPS